MRFTDHSIELAHDSIAALIDQNRTEEQRQLNQVLRRIKNSYIEYRDNEVYLTEKQLAVYEEFLPLLDLDEDILLFIEKSRAEAVRLKKAEEERKRARLLRRLMPVIIGLAIAAVIAWIYAEIQRREAENAKDRLAIETVNSDRNLSASLKYQGNYQEAINGLNKVKNDIEKLDLRQLEGSLDSINDQLENYRKIQLFMEEGDQLFKRGRSDRYT